MKKFLIKVNGNQYEVEVEEIRDGVVSQPVIKETKAASLVTETVTPPKAKESSAKVSKKDTAVPQGASTLKAPMPGSIIRVDVKVGDTVKKGQVLVILEAMKMENEIAAPCNGTITSVNVEKGDSVGAGDVLVSIG